MTGFSIVICTHNGYSRLPQTLSAISSLNFAGDWELILVDNCSDDGSSELVSRFLETNLHVAGRVISEPKAGLTYARQTGWRNANYSIVLFCDDDNWLASDYLKIAYSIFENNPNVGVLGGNGSPVSEKEFPTWFNEFSHSYAVGNNSKKSGKQKLGSAHYGAACFFLKEALDTIDDSNLNMVLSDRKGKELASGGDVELCFLVQLLGFDLWYEESLSFKHFITSPRLDWAYYLKLKKGIASSFPLLNSYKIFFENSPSIEKLRKQNYRQFWFAIKGVFLCQYRSFFRPSRKNSVQLIETKTKVKSFLQNHNRSIQHFEYLLKKFPLKSD